MAAPQKDSHQFLHSVGTPAALTNFNFQGLEP